MKKVLLVDTNFSSVPIYNEILKMGYDAHVVGGNPNDCLAKIAGKNYWNINYSNVDALRKLVSDQGFDFIVPGCTDRSYASCAIVSDGNFFGIDSVANDRNINNKMCYREIASELNLPIPSIQSDESNLMWPLIVKPVDAFSGKGITVILNKDENLLKIAIKEAKNASSSGNYLIENYIQGELYSQSAFLLDGKIIHDFFVHEKCSVNPFVVDTSRVTFDFPLHLKEKVRHSIEKLATHLKLKNGLFHTQFIVNNDTPWLIESTRRCPGDLYSQLIQMSTDFPYAKCYLSPFLDIDFDLNLINSKKNWIIRHTVTVNEPKSFYSLSFKENVCLARFIPLSLTGDQLESSPRSRVGVMFVSAENQNQENLIYQKFIDKEIYIL